MKITPDMRIWNH